MKNIGAGQLSAANEPVILLQGAADAEVKLVVADPLTGLSKGAAFETKSVVKSVLEGATAGLPSASDFPQFAAWNSSVAGLPNGEYKLVASVYRQGYAIPDDVKSLFFRVGSGVVSVPEIGGLLVPILLAVVLSVLWRKKRGAE